MAEEKSRAVAKIMVTQRPVPRVDRRIGIMPHAVTDHLADANPMPAGRSLIQAGFGGRVGTSLKI
jgi:hypothetical protein